MCHPNDLLHISSLFSSMGWGHPLEPLSHLTIGIAVLPQLPTSSLHSPSHQQSNGEGIHSRKSRNNKLLHSKSFNEGAYTPSEAQSASKLFSSLTLYYSPAHWVGLVPIKTSNWNRTIQVWSQQIHLSVCSYCLPLKSGTAMIWFPVGLLKYLAPWFLNTWNTYALKQF